LFLFFSTHAATTVIYTLSLHDALPISVAFLIALISAVFHLQGKVMSALSAATQRLLQIALFFIWVVSILGVILISRFESLNLIRSEEHTSELQSRENLVCRLLLEKKN